MTKKFAKGVNWDLSDHYKDISDPNIKADKKQIVKLVEAFISKYKGKISSPTLTAKLLANSLKDGQAIWELVYKYTIFAHLLKSKANHDEETGKFCQDAEEFYTQISSKLTWFGLERKEISDDVFSKIIKDKSLSPYKHSLKHERIFKPFVLSEKEEVLLTKTSPVGGSSLVRLFDLVTSTTKVELEVEGKLKSLTFSELSPYLSYHPKRSIRKKAAKAYASKLNESFRIYTLILNTLLLDSKTLDEIRGYKYPQHPTFLGYEIKPSTVNKMADVISSKYNICERYYLLKKKLLGYKELHEWDSYVLPYKNVQGEYTWTQAKNVVLSSFKRFDPSFFETAKLFFENNWIDADVTFGKSGGAFCSYNTPNRHPYILLNYNGKPSDVTTLAHELGHGIHACLSKGLPLAEFWPSTTVAEIASVFAELLVFDELYKNAKSKKEKINLLSEKLQNSFATVFRQNAFYLFEKDIHNHRRQKGELSFEEINSYYQNNLQKMFGKSLKLTNDHRLRWIPASHFYHYDFYVFTYAFGELLTNALYAKYKKEGKSFVDKYTRALKLGGSKNPYQITKAMGVNINDKDFWNEGLSMLESYVNEFEQLVS